MNEPRIAALYVDKRGPYAELQFVDLWDEKRDARLYQGPWPVVAHPPCERWGRYATGGPSAKVRRIKGDDGGCFAAALSAVRRWGGVLEHPAHSGAWKHFGLFEPDETGWKADVLGGWTCQVWQGHYGHRAAKATWLYAYGVRDLPPLRWGPCVGVRMDEGFHSAEERARARARCRSQADSEAYAEREPAYSNPVSRSARSDRRAREAGLRACEFLSTRQRALTPTEFRDILLNIAGSCSTQQGVQSDEV